MNNESLYAYDVFTAINDAFGENQNFKDHESIIYKETQSTEGGRQTFYTTIKKGDPLPAAFNQPTLNAILDLASAQLTQPDSPDKDTLKLALEKIEYMTDQRKLHLYGWRNCLGVNFLFLPQLFEMIGNYFKGSGYFETYTDSSFKKIKHEIETKLNNPAPSQEKEQKRAKEEEEKLIQEMNNLRQLNYLGVKGEKQTIVWHEKQIEASAALYNKANKDQIDPKKCKIGKWSSFTYYDATPPVPKDLKDKNEIERFKRLHQDKGWGCAWRASINQLEKMRVWLLNEHGFQTNINVETINMYDLAQWTHFPIGAWMEPITGAELTFTFIKKCYPQKDHDAIFKLIKPCGHLYSLLNREDCLREILSREIRRGVNKSKAEVFPLDNIRSHFWGADIVGEVTALAKGNKIPAKLTDEQRIKYKDHARDIDNMIDILSGMRLDPDYSIEKYWIVLMAMVKLYPEKTFHQDAKANEKNMKIKAMHMPELNATTNPFPFMIDDKYSARNIYGYHYNDEGEVTHVFIGETHVGFGRLGPNDNPWLDCTWQPVGNVFKATNQLMLLEIFPSAKDEAKEEKKEEKVKE